MSRMRKEQLDSSRTRFTAGKGTKCLILSKFQGDSIYVPSSRQCLSPQSHTHPSPLYQLSNDPRPVMSIGDSGVEQLLSQLLIWILDPTLTQMPLLFRDISLGEIPG